MKSDCHIESVCRVYDEFGEDCADRTIDGISSAIDAAKHNLNEIYSYWPPSQFDREGDMLVSEDDVINNFWDVRNTEGVLVETIPF